MRERGRTVVIRRITWGERGLIDRGAATAMGTMWNNTFQGRAFAPFGGTGSHVKIPAEGTSGPGLISADSKRRPRRFVHLTATTENSP